MAFAATLGLALGVRLLWKEGVVAPAEHVRQKSSSRLIAEGLRYRDCQTEGFDRFAFKRCRLEKRRKGAIIFGAFNVLAVDGLVVNLPCASAASSGSDSPAPEAPSSWLKDGLAETFLKSQSLGIGRVSALQINGLTVNRCFSNRVELIFSAAQADSGMSKDGLRLRGCVVHTSDGRDARVNAARLIVKPEPTLVYTKDGYEQRIGL